MLPRAAILAAALAVSGCIPSPTTIMAVGEAARCVAAVCSLYTQADGGAR